MKRSKKQYLQFLIKQRYGTQTDGAREMGINYFRLSKFITGAVNLKDAEINNIRKKLKLSPADFKRVLRGRLSIEFALNAN